MSGKKDAVAIRQAESEGGQKIVGQEAIDLPHNRYHRAARSSAAMSIVYAAMSGRELEERRKKIGHGGWDKWVEKNCEFNRITAWRYMTIAGQLKDKIQMFNALNISEKADSQAALIKLLDRPPSELLPAETEQLLKDIRQATEGQTLRQMYFDLGLASPPKPTGGANHLHSFLKKNYPGHPEYLKLTLRDLPKDVKAAWEKHLREAKDPNDDTEVFLATDTWETLIRHLREECLDKKSYALLPRAMIEKINGVLIDCKREFTEVLKK